MSVSNIIESNFLTYIAGILVPTTNISTTAAFNAVPTASVTLPPYPQLYGIGRRDRLPLHIFFKDPVDQTYKLFFEGEVTEFSYSDAVYDRSITVNAQGLLAFLHDINIKFMTALEDVASANVQGASDTSLKQFSPGITFPHSLFIAGMKEATAENLISVPFEYLDNVIKFVTRAGGKESSLGQWNSSVLAEFYAKYAAKLHLEDRYAKVPYFDDPDSAVWPKDKDNKDPGAKGFPLLAGVQKKVALEQLVGLSNSAVQEGTIASILNFIVNQMEYEFSIVQSPSFIDKKALTLSLKPMFYDTMPPACNVLYRSQVLNISSMEKVYGVPTRVRTSDILGTLVKLTNGAVSPITEYGLIDYFPSNKYKLDHVAPKNGESKDGAALPNYIGTEILDTIKEVGDVDYESHTGPWVFETAAPSWQSYVGPAAIGENRDVFKARLLSRLLMHKQYEARTLHVSSIFNPYVVPGYPGAVYDSKNPGFTFCGHVYSVSHSIGKSNMSSSIDMGFVRLVEEAVATPVPSPVESIDTVVKDFEKMEDIYSSTLGSYAMTWEAVAYGKSIEEQDNTLASYALQQRGIITLDEYMKFMQLSADYDTLPDGAKVPIIMYGDFVEDRKAINEAAIPPFEFEEGSSDSTLSSAEDLEGIRKILRIIAEREFSKEIFA